MKSTEFRIGNTIYSGTIVGLDDSGVIKVYDGYSVFFSDKMMPDWIKSQPIPLTPELLIQHGFENRHGNFYFYGSLRFEFNSMNILRFHYSQKVQWLQYLHQLQNLIFALTSSELK